MRKKMLKNPTVHQESQKVVNISFLNVEICLYAGNIEKHIRPFIMSTPFKGGRHIVLLRLASALALASGLTLRHPLLNFFLGAPKYDPSYMEIIFHW